MKPFRGLFPALALLLLMGCASQPVVSTLSHPEIAVVRIHATSPNDGRGADGRGFLISADGLIVTCRHLVNSASEIMVTLPDGQRRVARFLEDDPEGDAAIIQVPTLQLKDAPEKLPFLRLSDAGVEPGVHVRVVGEAGITHGLFDHWENLGRSIDFTARITPADSGAPLLGDDGRVIGVVRGAFPGRTSEYEATPIWRVLRMMPSLTPAR